MHHMHCSVHSQRHQQSVDAVVRPTFIWKLSYKLPGALKFTIIQTFGQNFVFFTEWCHVDRQCEAKLSKLRYFSVSVLKDWKVDKSKPTRKLKHANSSLEYFEYFCQMSSKSILIILSYTISNLARFFWDTVYVLDQSVISLQTQDVMK